MCPPHRNECLLPQWLFNCTLTDNSVWAHVPTKLVHPLALPRHVRANHAVVLKRTGPNQGLVKAAVAVGTFMKDSMLRSLRNALGFEVLKPAKGKRNKKIDFARGLVEHFFASASDFEKTKMVEAIMGQRVRHLKVECAEEVLEAFNALPADDQDAFGPIKFLSKDQADLKQRADSKEPRNLSTKVHTTPDEFKDIMPNVQGCYLTRHPVKKRFQACYPVDSPLDDYFIILFFSNRKPDTLTPYNL